MIQIRAIDHIVLRVLDLDRMVRFYCDVLACTVERHEQTLGLMQLRAGQCLIDLVPVDGKLGSAGGAPPGKDARNLDHFCLQIDPFNANDITRFLQKHGIEAGEAVTRYGAQGNGPSIYIADPEGNTIELKGPPDHA